MRIISGVFKSRLIKISGNDKNVRPTTDRARESLFNILSNRINLNDKICLDLFCGTGSFGLECLSRGAKEAFFVDKRINNVKENISALGVENKSIIVRKDAVLFIKNYVKDEFDIAFADPPYDFKRYRELIDEISNLKILFILEHSDKFVLEETNKEKVFLHKKLGDTNFTFFDFR